MGRVISFIYGLLCWFGFLAAFLYLIGFLGDFMVPKTVNSGAQGPAMQAILINIFLIALFGIHHSITARPSFKKMLTQYLPKHLERSTYVLFSNILIFIIYWQWRPITTVIWEINSYGGQIIMWALFAFGWATVVISSFLINHFDLFGVRQVYFHLKGKEYEPVHLKVKFFYKFIRNPIMLGWFMGFWCTPHMTVGHLVFAGGMTVYGFIGMFFEERNLLEFLGEDYKQYRTKTPMILPFPKFNKA